MDMTSRIYRVHRIDGDYAYLLQEDKDSGTVLEGAEEKCVARALLPAEIAEGSRLLYECMQYEMMP
ncbi:MAG: hypothetical protein NC413_12225 [Muribaculum sp.]|nr:hypothetical protein [Muribaculum sp.]